MEKIMLRKLNRKFQDYMRPKRLKIGRLIWDRKKEKPEKLDMEQVKSILIMRDDGKIGDMVITTAIFREIKKVYPNIKIGLILRENTLDIVKNNRYIDKKYIYEKGKEGKLGKEISKERYDILINFSELLRVNQMKLVNLSNAKINIGLNKEGWNLFQISYKKNDNEHISELYKTILKIIGIDNPDMSYDIEIPKEVSEKVDRLVEKDKEIVILNPYAASKHRSLNRENILKVSKKLLQKDNRVLYIIGEKSKESEIKDIISELGERVKYPKLDGILGVASLISKANYVVTPDTSIVHITAAFKIPMIAIYRADSEEDRNSKLWAPNYSGGKQIFSYDLNRKDGEESDINLFNIEEIDF